MIDTKEEARREALVDLTFAAVNIPMTRAQVREALDVGLAACEAGIEAMMKHAGISAHPKLASLIAFRELYANMPVIMGVLSGNDNLGHDDFKHVPLESLKR